MKKGKRGFTLIEVVVCTALLAIITAGFLSMTLTGLSITEKMNAYVQQTANLVTAYETGELSDGLEHSSSTEQETMNIDQFHAGTFYLYRHGIHAEGEESGMTYYDYK